MPKKDELTEKQKIFCREYIYDWNGSRAYKVAYPDVTEETARANSSRLLTNAKVSAYLKDIQSNLEKIAGVSRLRIAQEHLKIVNTSIAHLHNGWITRKEFDQLTDDQKCAIQEISTSIRKEAEYDPVKEEYKNVEVEYIKIKLYDRQKSMDALNRLFGYDAAEKLEISGSVKSYKIVGSAGRTGNSSK